MQGISGIGYSGYSYSSKRSVEQTTATPFSTTSDSAAGSTAASGGTSGGPSASPGGNRLAGQNGVAAILGNGEQVTGGVTATLPDGITIGVWSLAQTGSDQGASSSKPDYSSMAAALEQMVDQFMASDSGSASAAAVAAQQAYGSQPVSSDPTAQGDGANVVA
jgi:hypothetical protein